MSSPDEDSLRRMPLSELKKYAKKYGIRKSMKANNIIASILNQKKEDEDSFVTLERNIINSCKKNKELLFEEDKKVVSDSPRRDTYTVDDPLTDLETINASIVATSASPELKKTNLSDIFNEKTAQESVKKNRKSKRKVSFVTPMRRSARLLSTTPQYNSLKGRPKTPIPNRSSKRMSSKGNKNVVADSLNLDSSAEDTNTSSGKVKRPSTPMPISQKRKRLSSGNSEDTPTNLKPVTDVLVLQELKEETSEETPSKSFYATPNASSDAKKEKENLFKVDTSNKNATPLPSSTIKSAKKATATPSKQAVSSKKTVTKSPGLRRATPFSSKKALLTPGFKPIKTPLTKSKSTIATPGFKSAKTPMSKNKNTIATPGFKPIKTPQSISQNAITRSAVKFGMSSSAARLASTPIPGLNLISTPGQSLKEISTPNFSKIHQVAFDKMESIDDYQKRKALNSAKKLKEQRKFHAPVPSNINKKVVVEKVKKSSKSPSGIPFVKARAKKQTIQPSNYAQMSSGLKSKKTAATKSVPLNASSLPQKLIKAGNAKAIKSVAKENTPLKQRQKFDLRASLAKKLTYKPHTGPIKPLNEKNYKGNVSVTLPPAKMLQTENQVVNNSRLEARDVLRGVRKNKRFLLQMSNRNLSMQQ